MDSFVSENWESVNNSYDAFDTVEIDSAFLISQLLDESQVEDCDDERLTSVIRSLEAEITEPVRLIEDVDHSFMELEWDDNMEEFCNYSDDVMNGQDCSTSSDDSYNWMDMEENMIEFEGARDYLYYSNYNSNSYAANLLEEQSYGSLWQDTNVLIM